LSEKCPIADHEDRHWNVPSEPAEHVSTIEGPVHLLLLNHAFADKRIYSRLGKGGGDTEPGSMAIAIVDDRAAVRAEPQSPRESFSRSKLRIARIGPPMPRRRFTALVSLLMLEMGPAPSKRDRAM
jgi:hypothetical protein